MVMHLSMLSLREGGRGRAKQGSLIVRSVPWVGIMIVCDVPKLAILIVQRTFYHVHLPPSGQLFCPRGGEFEFFSMKMSKSAPHARPPPPSGFTLIGASPPIFVLDFNNTCLDLLSKPRHIRRHRLNGNSLFHGCAKFQTFPYTTACSP